MYECRDPGLNLAITINWPPTTEMPGQSKNDELEFNKANQNLRYNMQTESQFHKLTVFKMIYGFLLNLGNKTILLCKITSW